MIKDIGDKLRFLRRSKGYTQKDLGKLLNIGQTTIANYENGSRIPDLLKLKDISDVFQVSLDYLLDINESVQIKHKLNIQSQLNFSPLVYRDYMEALLGGDKKTCTNICLSMLESGVDISKIYQNIIGKSLIQTGTLWEKGDLDIWKEHMISEFSKDIICILHSRYKHGHKINKTLIGLTPGSEIHNIGLKMVCSIFELAGWNSLYLGSNIPTLSVLNAIEAYKPEVIALSITNPDHLESAKHLVEAIRKHCPPDTLSIIAGGAGLHNTDALKVLKGITYHIKDFDNLISNFYSFDFNVN